MSGYQPRGMPSVGQCLPWIYTGSTLPCIHWTYTAVDPVQNQCSHTLGSTGYHSVDTVYPTLSLVPVQSSVCTSTNQGTLQCKLVYTLATLPMGLGSQLRKSIRLGPLQSYMILHVLLNMQFLTHVKCKTSQVCSTNAPTRLQTMAHFSACYRIESYRAWI